MGTSWELDRLPEIDPVKLHHRLVENDGITHFTFYIYPTT